MAISLRPRYRHYAPRIELKPVALFAIVAGAELLTSPAGCSLMQVKSVGVHSGIPNCLALPPQATRIVSAPAAGYPRLRSKMIEPWLGHPRLEITTEMLPDVRR